jgi:hypothetical protein
VSQNNDETGLQDLLFNGAIACFLLFIVIGINLTGFSLYSSANGEQVADYSSKFSLPIKTEHLKGKMKVAYFVQIKPDSKLGESAKIRSMYAANKSNFKWNAGSFKAEEMGWMLQGDTLVYFLIGTQASGQTNFLVDPPHNVFTNASNGQVRVRLLEGVSSFDNQVRWRDFKGVTETKWIPNVQLENLQITIQRDKDPGKIVKVNSSYFPLEHL